MKLTNSNCRVVSRRVRRARRPSGTRSECSPRRSRSRTAPRPTTVSRCRLCSGIGASQKRHSPVASIPRLCSRMRVPPQRVSKAHPRVLPHYRCTTLTTQRMAISSALALSETRGSRSPSSPSPSPATSSQPRSRSRPARSTHWLPRSDGAPPRLQNENRRATAVSAVRRGVGGVAATSVCDDAMMDRLAFERVMGLAMQRIGLSEKMTGRSATRRTGGLGEARGRPRDRRDVG